VQHRLWASEVYRQRSDFDDVALVIFIVGIRDSLERAIEPAIDVEVDDRAVRRRLSRRHKTAFDAGVPCGKNRDVAGCEVLAQQR